jgi:serine/threonine-protein kinase
LAHASEVLTASRVRAAARAITRNHTTAIRAAVAKALAEAGKHIVPAPTRRSCEELTPLPTRRTIPGVEDSLGLTGRSLLDRYEVGNAIAHGGMAIIYEGRDRRLYRPVSIKVFHRLRPGEAAYKTAYEHFVQEAFALSQFSHPNTLRIYDFGYLEGDVAAPFFISELLEGGTLSQLVRRHGPLDPHDAQEILEPVAGALAEAHARGIVHRDIKPSNILFGLAGAKRVVKLCDFGIAKVVDVTDAHLFEQLDAGIEGTSPDWRAEDTHLGSGVPLRLYSPGWAAPEQVLGEQVGPPADIYALGLLTGYVLTGRPLVSPKDDDRQGRGRTDDLEVRIAAALDGAALAPSLVDFVRHACRTRVADRIATADEFAARLRAAVRAATRDERRERRETEPFRRSAEIPIVASGAVAGDAVPTPGGVASTGSGSIALPLPAPALAPDTSIATPTPTPTPTLVVAPSQIVEAASAPAPALLVDPDGKDEVLVAGRRMRLVALGGSEQLDLGGDSPWLRSPARFRVTITPSKTSAPRVNVKGLNCFVVKPGARPSTAIDVEADLDVDLIAPDRRTLDKVRCSVGRPGGGSRLYDLGDTSIAVPAIAGAVMLDLGPGRELALLHRGSPVRRKR